MDKAIRAFNRFASRESKRKDFEKVKDFAVNDFFTRQTEADKETIATSYAKIETGRAGIYDMQVVMNYWKACRREYGKIPKAEGNTRGTSLA
jgi:hypothetical protein